MYIKGTFDASQKHKNSKEDITRRPEEFENGQACV
jgi:hypothetical protein